MRKLAQLKHGCLALVSVVLVVFACLAAVSQFSDEAPDKYGVMSIAQLCLKQQRLAQSTNLVELEAATSGFDGVCRRLDLMLPKDGRVFVQDMIGPANRSKCLMYHYLTYYLFPRDVAVSLDQPARFTKDGFPGRPAESDQELLTHGFDVVVDTANDTLQGRVLHDLFLEKPANPAWFRNRSAAVKAFLLPLLTALAGLWLVRALFPALYQRIPLLERLACGLGLGMMAVAALTLGLKLCGFHGRGLVFLVTGAGAVTALWSQRRAFWAGIAGGFQSAMHNPVMMVGLLVFLLVFRVAGVFGLVESDAVAAWMLKAKIMHLCTGGEIVRWFSEPRLAHAHLDYPTLVPSLHAATFDAIGHVDEHLTKFWPAWMLLLLVAALASLNRDAKGWLRAPSFFLLALVLLPSTRKYVLMEGGTLPMVFFTVLGFLQCALWHVEKDGARLGLGLTLLFGAAMAKFEGFIFLAVAGGWLWLVPSMRPRLRASPLLWRVLGFWFLAALPFLCLRVQIPVLHYESGWAGYALRHPGDTLSNWPGIFMMIISRWFVSSSLASWSGADGQLHWVGRWEGLSSLYNPPTLGLAWLGLLMTVALWLTAPARRQLILWMLAVIVSSMAAFSAVFASFVGVTSLNQVIDYTQEITAARYLFPILVAWSATVMTLLFAESNWAHTD